MESKPNPNLNLNLNLNLRALAQERERRRNPIAFELRQRNRARDERTLLRDVVGFTGKYKPKEALELLTGEFEYLSQLGAEALFGEKQAQNPERAQYVVELMRDLVRRLTAETQSEESSRAKGRKRFVVAQERKEALSVAIDLNRKAGIALQKQISEHLAHAHFAASGITLLIDQDMPDFSVVLPSEAVEHLMQTGYLDEILLAENSFPFAILKNDRGNFVALRIVTGPALYGVQVSPQMFSMLSTGGGKVDLYVLTEPHASGIKLVSVAEECGTTEVSMEHLAETIDRNYSVLFIGQEIKYRDCYLMVVRLTDVLGQEVAFASSYYRGMPTELNLELVLRERMF
ncbi:MAG: hypothetical protein ACYCOU_08140 [Sulfobacillus sp.]